MAISINSKVIADAAATMSRLNTELQDILKTTQSEVNALSGIWTGEASETTIASYNAFSSKYFSTYKELIDNYVKFLNEAAVANYSEVEKKNKKLADEF